MLLMSLVLLPAVGALAGAAEQPLRDTIVFRIGQTGFGGVTGTEYRIDPNGAWRAVTFVDERTMGVVGEGQLDRNELTMLSDQLSLIDFSAIRERAKGFEGINPSSVELRYGSEIVTATLPPGHSLDQPCPQGPADPICQFFRLADFMRTHLSTK
jgi:hypothetical protein